MLDNETENLTPETVTETPENAEGAPTVDQAQSEQDEAQKLLDLDSVEKFRFADREWTREELKNSYLMHKDYTQKTQELAKERKYYDALSYDLEKVRSNPALIAQFKSIYPAKFHRFVEGIGSNQAKAQTQSSVMENPAKPALDPEFLDRFNKLESHFQSQAQKAAAAEQKAADAEVDANCARFGQKYDSVKGSYEVLALNMLSAKLDRLKADDPEAKLTDKDWDQAYKSVHEQNQKLAEQLYSQKVKKQTEANARGKDSAAGGGIPGQAPKQARTIKEAAEETRRLLSQQG